jgi:hypothetical protein
MVYIIIEKKRGLETMKKFFVITAVSAMMIFTGCSQSTETVQTETVNVDAQQDSNSGSDADNSGSEASQEPEAKMSAMKMGQITEIDGTGITVKTADFPNGEPSGEKPDGEPNGEKPDGEPNGEKPDGEPNGEKPDGEPNGEKPDGEPNGEKPDGEPNGEKPDGEPNGEQPNMTFDGEEISITDVTGILKKNTSQDAKQDLDQLEDADISELAVNDVVQIIYGDNDEIKYIVVMPAK